GVVRHGHRVRADGGRQQHPRRRQLPHRHSGLPVMGWDYLRSQRSQSMAEFALIAPILLVLLFGMVDFGRAVYYYVTIEQAASEGGRVAVRNSAQLPSDADVETA